LLRVVTLSLLPFIDEHKTFPGVWEGEKEAYRAIIFFMAFLQDQQNKLYEMLFEKLIGFRAEEMPKTRPRFIGAKGSGVAYDKCAHNKLVDKRSAWEENEARMCA
jgi:hypothetical protein